VIEFCTSQVSGCKDGLQNDLLSVEWDVRSYFIYLCTLPFNRQHLNGDGLSVGWPGRLSELFCAVLCTYMHTYIIKVIVPSHT